MINTRFGILSMLYKEVLFGISFLGGALYANPRYRTSKENLQEGNHETELKSTSP